ncbi:hypothetical protein LCGC14_2784190 [marine sediment metagenome]|uniref:Uncharacterized protein n=1 Tax=marine sediment metagenome TaxID=412755 RepID=A0A0F8XYJ1_9ZZZZ
MTLIHKVIVSFGTAGFNKLQIMVVGLISITGIVSTMSDTPVFGLPASSWVLFFIVYFIVGFSASLYASNSTVLSKS